MQEKPCPRCNGTERLEYQSRGKILTRCATCKRAIDAAYKAEKKAARAGWSPAHDMTHTVPAGFRVKGVSSLYGADGALAAQWVKTAAEEEDRLAALAEAVQGIAEPFRALADPVPAATIHDADTLSVYPMGDPHVGMYAWAEETGQSFDLGIAEDSLVAAVDHLVDLAPPSEHALLIDLGDFFHGDNSQNRTARSGHALDIDTRWAKVLRIGIRIVRRGIDRALEKHKHVTFVPEIGNHDDQSAIMLGLCLANYYEREPRVTIDTSPAKFHWYEFGKALIGITHTDTVKPHQLPGIMATDKPEAWGRTLYRRWYCGHIHHDQELRRKEYPGCVVENMRTLSPKDAWASAAGYRADQDMKLDVVHREWGWINRHIVGIRQVWHRLREGA